MPKKNPKERQLVVAITAGTIWTPSVPTGVNFAPGDVFGADEEHVKRAPRYFVPSTATSAEIHAAKVAINTHEVNQEPLHKARPATEADLERHFIRR